MASGFDGLGLRDLFGRLFRRLRFGLLHGRGLRLGLHRLGLRLRLRRRLRLLHRFRLDLFLRLWLGRDFGRGHRLRLFLRLFHHLRLRLDCRRRRRRGRFGGLHRLRLGRRRYRCFGVDIVFADLLRQRVGVRALGRLRRRLFSQRRLLVAFLDLRQFLDRARYRPAAPRHRPLPSDAATTARSGRSRSARRAGRPNWRRCPSCRISYLPAAGPRDRYSCIRRS